MAEGGNMENKYESEKQSISKHKATTPQSAQDDLDRIAEVLMVNLDSEEEPSAEHVILPEETEIQKSNDSYGMKGLETTFETTTTANAEGGVYEDDGESQETIEVLIKDEKPVEEMKEIRGTNSTLMEGVDTGRNDSLAHSHLSQAMTEPSPQFISGTVCPDIDTTFLPRVGSIREKFELSSHESKSNVFSFGDAFLEKQREYRLDQKRKLKEARDSIHGFDEMMIHQGKSPESMIDISPMQKTFAFEGSMPDDGESKDRVSQLQFIDMEYKTGIFVVHSTRGMLLLKSREQSNSTSVSGIPGGIIDNELFIEAGTRSGHCKMQLQLAAREGAARHLFDQTGIDARGDLDRLQPAVLHLDPPVDAGNGMKLLKNEFNRRLYYFYQASTEDFVNDTEDENSEKKLVKPEGENESILMLRLSSDFSAFIFLKEPMKAMEVLQIEGDEQTPEALNMIMHEASIAPKPYGNNDGNPEDSDKQMTNRGEAGDQLNRQVELEAAKLSVVDCCCCWRK